MLLLRWPAHQSYVVCRRCLLMEAARLPLLLKLCAGCTWASARAAAAVRRSLSSGAAAAAALMQLQSSCSSMQQQQQHHHALQAPAQHMMQQEAGAAAQPGGSPAGGQRGAAGGRAHGRPAGGPSMGPIHVRGHGPHGHGRRGVLSGQHGAQHRHAGGRWRLAPASRCCFLACGTGSFCCLPPRELAGCPIGPLLYRGSNAVYGTAGSGQ